MRPTVGFRVNARRLRAHLAGLAKFGSVPGGGVTRLAYGEADRQARAHVRGLMRAAGLVTRVDAAGNLVGRLGRAAGPPIVLGSHIDSVPRGGRFDGALGSLAAIEVARTLGERGATLRKPLEVIVFQNEEGGLIGSRALCGELAPRELDRTSLGGKTIREGIRFLGGSPGNLAPARRRRGEVAAFLELHIEQGGILEAARADIGVVEGIVGIRRFDVRIEGETNHSGTTPMKGRRDALLAAAELILAVNRVASRPPGRQVGTIGTIAAFPGALNQIPGRVELGLELRALERRAIDRLEDRIRAAASRISRRRKTAFRFRARESIAPVPTDRRVRRAVAGAARELGLVAIRMPSGAGHDAQSMARIAPAGMLFVPSVGGVSHSPRERTTARNVANGANVLLHAVLRLDRSDGT